MTVRAALACIGVSALTLTTTLLGEPFTYRVRDQRLLSSRDALGWTAVARAEAQAEKPQSAADRIENAYRASNRGVARLEQFDYDAAVVAFREALGIDPSLAAARANLAIALYYAGQIDAAQQEARTAESALPKAPQPPYMLGLIAKGQNNSEEAIAAFKRALQIDPEDVGSRVNLGQVYLQERNVKEALPMFREALAHEPYNVTAAYGLATTLLRNGEPDAGREAMQQFQMLRDSAYGVTYAPGYLQQGRNAEAIVSTGAEPELVDEATPRVTFADATPPAIAPRPPDQVSAAGERLTLFDMDGDGDQDLLVVDAAALHLYRNDGGRFTDVTAATKLDARLSGRGVAAVAGDYDNDGKPDLFLLRDEGPRLLHQRADGTFEDVTGAALGSTGAMAARTAAFVDVDHDGDLDILIAGISVSNRLLRNNGDGTFTDIASAAGTAGPPARAISIVPTDYDNRRDIDLLVVNEDRAPTLYQNMRDGTFRDVAQEVGLAAAGPARAVAAGDVNKDGYTDFFIARAGQPPVFAMSDGRNHFVLRDAPPASADAVAAQLVDYDNDGLLDLLTCGPGGLRLFRNLGTRWVDVSGAASVDGSKQPFTQLAIADLDGDGDSDLITTNDKAELKIWRNDGGNRNPAIRVQLAARVSNRSGEGTKVEVRAGALREKLETSSTTPAVAPADLIFGLGRRAAADIVRVLWPSGILQTEIVPTPTAAASGPVSIKVEELDRKPSSCPFLFTWNGSRFEFVTDFLGGGEMGDWIAPGVFNQPDPDEYVRIRGDQLRPRDGHYELRITNELEEAMFLDRVELVAIDHPQDVDVYPNEGLRSPPLEPFRIYTTEGAHPPRHAIDEHGHDVTALIRSVDRRAPDDFGLSRIRGYADRHELILDLGAASDRVVLLLTGWTEYAFSNDNVAAGQAGLAMQPPRLEMKDEAGNWRTVIEDVGFPVGRPQTIAVDLTGKFPGRSREVRIVTNMRIYWDQVLVDTSPGQAQTRLTRVSPTAATLRSRGFSAETSPDGRPPFTYDYTRVGAVSPWKVPAGRYTKYGDVRPLLLATDDMFAIAAPGDEVALTFDAASLPQLHPGFTRTFLLYADGFSKEMNIRSATPDAVAPLPFHAMRSYPYGAGESYPDTPEHRDYLARYNTRIVTAPVPSLELSTTLALDHSSQR
jgi:tetratricopeptide (TPR) repeat protein